MFSSPTVIFKSKKLKVKTRKKFEKFEVTLVPNSTLKMCLYIILDILSDLVHIVALMNSNFKLINFNIFQLRDLFIVKWYVFST